ncbi:potassium transporter TrkA [Streptomyces spongiicola]|uniref:Potassium transporter TrkA n=2 Tax=Streptomyces spongiicola TaxID=1690221 RepID=A0A2S1Z6T8_9ACTN|nr:potassium transporter TrkA [Streptomyces spongiicola]GBP99068.1 potassium transporter TrkA [Streptomyces spongiicola]
MRPSTGHMLVSGDDALAHRLAAELRDVYRQQVTLLVPPSRSSPGLPADSGAPSGGRALALLGRVSAGIVRTGGNRAAADGEGGRPNEMPVLETHDPDDDALREAGVETAQALALVHENDETNIRAALTARRLNPRLRLVIRLYNRKLGQHLEELLDQAAVLAVPGMAADDIDSSTTVLSDADTAAPALAATAVTGTSKIVQADGLLLRAAERPPPGSGGLAEPGLCTLALLSSTSSDPGGVEGSEDSGSAGPLLLPDDRAVAAAPRRGRIVLEAVTGPEAGPGSRLSGPALPFRELFSRRVRWSFAGVATAVAALAVASWLTGGGHPLHAAYITLLDLFAINDPAVDGETDRQILQLLTGLVGLLLLPLLVAAVLEALSSFRSATALRRPPRGLAGHVVLLGLGKIGTRVLGRLREIGIPVVCVENDPEARGVALARRLRVPVIIGDVTQEGVLDAARIHRAHALLALTSSDTTNLEAALYARSIASDLRVALRLYDDDFATAVYRTLRAAHPGALTRSRSVTSLSAPAFAGAMMGRQVLGAISVERRVLLFAALEVAELPRLEGHTIAEARRPGMWRVLALDMAAPGDRRPDLSAAPPDDGAEHTSGLLFDLHPGHLLRPGDRVVVAATRRGLAELLGHRTR